MQNDSQSWGKPSCGVARHCNNHDVQLEEMPTMQGGFGDFRYIENVR